MPELPEVEIVCRQLQSQIKGSTIQHITLNRQDIIRQGLTSLPWYLGTRVADIQRQGKSIVLTCERKEAWRYWIVELGMTGLLLFDRQTVPSEKHLHVTMHLSKGRQKTLHYWNARRFGRMYLLDEEEWEAFRQRRFGGDPLAMSKQDFVALLKGCRGRVKALLLNQHRLAGIGNIYANEMLFRAGIHPHAHGNRLSIKRIHVLFDEMQKLLKEAIEKGGSSIRDYRAPNGTKGQFQQYHQIYQKTGLPCPRGCPNSVRRMIAERSSFFCPTCQRR